MPMFSVADCGTRGIAADQFGAELVDGAWTAGSNIAFRDGYVSRADGYGKVFGSPPVAPYWLLPVVSGAGNRYMVYGGLSKLYAARGETHYNITRSSGGDYAATADKRWTGGVLSGVVVVNNGVDVPQFWGPQDGGNAAALTGWNANWRCAVLRPFKAFLVALDITKSGTRYPYMVKWSHSTDPGTVPSSWDESDATKDAGELDLGDTPGTLIDCLTLGDSNVIYKEDAIWLQRYTGGNEIFRFDRVSDQAGALAANCIDAIPGGHVVLAPGDVFLFNGSAPTSIVDSRMRRWLFNRMDSVNYRRSFVRSDLRRQEVWIAFPVSGSTGCAHALVWNYKDNSFSVRDLPNVPHAAFGQIEFSQADSWDADSQPWNSDATAWDQSGFSAGEKRFVFASGTSLFITESQFTADGTPIDGYVERTGMHLGDPSRVKHVSAVYPKIDGVEGQVVTVQIGASQSADGAITWRSPVSFTVGTSYKADVRAAGKFIALRFRNSDSLAPWRMRSFDLEYVIEGAR